MPNQNLIMQANHTLVAWNSHSFWFCVGASSKKEYTIYELSDVIKDVPVAPLPVAKTFKVGDHIIGNSTASDRYAMTKEGWRGIVTEIISDREIKADTLSIKGNNYSLCTDYFDVIPIISLSELKIPLAKPFFPKKELKERLKTLESEKVKLLPLIAVKTRVII
jgi:hypothetical protein